MAVHYYPYINKFITRLNLRDKIFREQVGKKQIDFEKPFITIAREPGSGGAPIAREVAKRLGFLLVDEQIVEDITKSTKKRKAVVKALDEKQRSAIQDFINTALNTDHINDVRYTKELVRVILAYAHQGNTVILGRGANFITPFTKGLHVNITAPYDVRVVRAMKHEGHSKEKARKVIAKVEEERSQFVKQYLSSDLNKKNAYDLTLNTSCFNVKEASQVIVEAFYRKFSLSVRYGAILGK